MQSSLPDDIAIQIASSLQATDVCALGSCSRFWRGICGSNCIWESLARKRWPFLGFTGESSSVTVTKNPELAQHKEPFFKEWRSFYINKHNEMAGRAASVIEFVDQCSLSDSLEVGDYLKAIETLSSVQFGFEDVRMFLFKPKFSVLLNLVGLHYCIDHLKVPAAFIMAALLSCNISERQVCVKWWKLGRWFYGFRMRDESYSRLVSLADLSLAKEEEVLQLLQRGAVHEVLRVELSFATPSCTPWSCQPVQVQD